jgi:hypothetical protein
VIGTLRADPEGKVLRALLGNPRLVEADAQALASSASAPREILAALAEHATWGARHAVRLALARNPRTPARSALLAVEGLSRADLARLAREGEAPRLVQVAASRKLDASAGDPGKSEG